MLTVEGQKSIVEVQEIKINLDAAPKDRWKPLMGHEKEINELLGYYLEDFEGAEVIFEMIKSYKDYWIPKSYQDEIEFISTISDFSSDQVLVANLYYDILKSYFGCTAFALETGDSLFHARNLDWHTENGILGKYTTVFDYQKNGTTLFKAVGWKGFVGVLSGMKPKNFSVTLNAILSNDAPIIAYPISFHLRDVLDGCANYSEARKSLETKEIASDCLLLLSGIKENEFAVIERTPTRFATRKGTDSIVVTNDYKLLEDSGKSSVDNILSTTSCGRFDRATELLRENSMSSIDHCLDVLKDESVQMNITVQQMVFDNRSGELKVFIPPNNYT